MRFLARPFTWLVVAEVLVVVALGLVTWHIVSTRVPTAPPLSELGQPPSALLPGIGAPTSAPVPVLVTPTPRRLGPTPALAMSSTFFTSELATLNREQSAWERSEWTIISAVLGFARGYIEDVVLPGVRAAESGRR